MAPSQHRGRPSLDELTSAFPRRQVGPIWDNQREALEQIARHGSMLLELPTGSGKTAVGMAVLRALAKRGDGPLFYIVPTKSLVGQVKEMFPEVVEAYGRNEYDCLYYEPDEFFKADEIPCLLLQDCAHRVDQETGVTVGKGVAKCPYYLAKYEAKRQRSRIVVCTMSFFLFTQLFSKEFEAPAGLVIDEVQEIPDVVRGALSFSITDYHLERAINLLSTVAPDEAATLEIFLETMLRIIRLKPRRVPVLLQDVELQELLLVLKDIDRDRMRSKVVAAIRSGEIDVKKEREVLTRVERVVYDLFRYLRSFEFSLGTESRHPLNYTYAYWDHEPGEGTKVRNRLTVQSWAVGPVIRKLAKLSDLTIAYGATIGDPEIFGYESGLSPKEFPCAAFPSTFPAGNARIFVPSDTPSLAVKELSKRTKATSIRKIVRACKRFNDAGKRCLVVMVSEDERQRFIRMATEDSVNFITYGEDGVTARAAAERFRSGEGEVLLGTVAQYGQGIDLPSGICPVIIFLRPAYAPPNSPQMQFETERFGGRRWSVWQYRVIKEALQVRGRNIRSATDKGITIFFDRRFQKFVYGSLPKWLQDSYVGNKTLDECIDDALEVLS